ncbi:hypothetical protein V5O48_010098 [Marasmius crinis-equi]|uniref:F-box domain-containing protein n=1 Tax=Marasmius crinis-equi TaxID=585013 RepID=A0ABR3F9A4_9AGAR
MILPVFPLEIWENILLRNPGRGVLAVMRASKALHRASQHAFLSDIHWKDMDGFITNNNQLWSKIKDNTLATIPRAVTIGRPLTIDNPIKWDKIWPTLQTFVNLSRLTIHDIQFPLHDIFLFLESLPQLESLSMSRIRHNSLLPPSRGPTRSTYTDSLCKLVVKHLIMDNRLSDGDMGFFCVAELLARPGLEEVELTMDTFADVIGAFDMLGGLFSPSLTCLNAQSPTFTLTDDELFQDDWCRMIQCSLQRCAPVLQYLRLWSAAHPVDAPPPLHLPALVEYICPHEMLAGLTFPSSIAMIWVPAPVVMASIPFRMSRRLSACSGSAHLRFLSVLRWSASDTRIELIFDLFPVLEELSIELSSPLSKAFTVGLVAKGDEVSPGSLDPMCLEPP